MGNASLHYGEVPHQACLLGAANESDLFRDAWQNPVSFRSSTKEMDLEYSAAKKHPQSCALLRISLRAI